MSRTQKIDANLAALAVHLASRRADLLENWHNAVEADPQLSSPSALPRTQFNDHIPNVLAAFEHRLNTWPSKESAASDRENQEDAAAHGLQRWQQGYQLREVTREWGHLQLCLADELGNYALAHPGLEPEVMSIAWRALAQLCSEGVIESTAQYFQLRQTEAAGHVQDLKQALDQVHELERRRAELWRQAAHDLRGNLGVVVNATTGLTLTKAPEPVRDEFVRLLQKSVSSLHSMLEDLMGLARLQAGHEQRVVQTFDAGKLLRELCEGLQPQASQLGLFLKADGADLLQVQGDPVKIRRITQNLLLNALKYTRQGGVTVSWGDSRDNDAERWMLSVQDTGPGFHAGPGALLAGVLKEATKDARELEDKAGEGEAGDGAAQHSPASGSSQPDPRPVHQEPGEGIGLSIVKRLCELLDASLELESKPGEGTIFRVIFPRSYAAARPQP